MRSIVIALLCLTSALCSAQAFAFEAYLRTDGDDKIINDRITFDLTTKIATIHTADTTIKHRVITRRDWPYQSEVHLSCGGKMTIHYDYDKLVESVFYHCPSISIFASHGFVQAFRDGQYHTD